jgi:ATP:corrinoid adenosyltransferase
MANRNRTAGLNFERYIAQRINSCSLQKELTGKEIEELDEKEFKVFPKVGTTRKLSRALDAKKIDITTENPKRLEEFPYIIQAKNTTNVVHYPKLLFELQTNGVGGIPVVFHRHTKKANTKFITTGEYVCMHMEDFLDIITELHKLKLQINGSKDNL